MPVSLSNTLIIEAEVAPGLETISAGEVSTHLHITPETGSGWLQFSFSGDLRRLFDLKTVNSVYLVLSFEVPRPKALLGHQHFQQLLAEIQTILRLHPAGSFLTLYIDAAGSDSSVMQRIKAELATATGLAQALDENKGDLQIRLRRSRSMNGWDALLRLTPRPLATRFWRIQNFEGALNAAVAHAMISLTVPTPEDYFLNPGCGSGTLLIERFAAGDARQIIGCDLDPVSMNYTRMNTGAAGVHPMLMLADMQKLPFPDASIDKLCADLPFGQLVGSHQQNTRLYPAMLQESARIARSQASFVLITHEIRLIDSLLRQSSVWYTAQTYKITLNGLHPRIYHLKRR